MKRIAPLILFAWFLMSYGQGPVWMVADFPNQLSCEESVLHQIREWEAKVGEISRKSRGWLDPLPIYPPRPNLACLPDEEDV